MVRIVWDVPSRRVIVIVSDPTALTVPAAGVLANDSDVDGNPLTAIQTSNPAGTVVLNPDGSFTYTTTASYVGTRVFKYRANDGSLNSAIVNVTLIKDLTVSSITRAANLDWIIRGRSTKPNAQVGVTNTTTGIPLTTTTGQTSVTVGGNGAWTFRTASGSLLSGQQISALSSIGAQVIEVPVP